MIKFQGFNQKIFTQKPTFPSRIRITNTNKHTNKTRIKITKAAFIIN